MARRIVQRRPMASRTQKLIERRVSRRRVSKPSITIARESVKQSKTTVNYKDAWNSAIKHFNKGMAGAYLQHMEKEARENPQIGAIYEYIKALDKQRRAGTTQFDPKVFAETGKIVPIMEGGKPKIFPGDISPWTTSSPAAIEWKEQDRKLQEVDKEYKLSTSASDILAGKIFKKHPVVERDLPAEAQLKQQDIWNIIRGKNVGKIIDEKRKILEKINIQETSRFKTSLDSASKELPSGVSFAKDTRGNVIGIIDKNKNRRVPINLLHRYIVDDKLIKLGLVGFTKAIQDISKIKITQSEEAGKKLVTLPSGLQFKISSTGRVNVEKAFAGQDLVFQDGVLRKIDGIDIYDDKVKPVAVPKRDQIISIQRAKDLSKKWKQDISTTKTRLTNANKRGDASRLAELQRLGKNRTTAQNKEFNRLQTQTAKNYELGGELVGKIIGTSLINMGVGSTELLKALKANPKETLIALPPAIFTGVKEDFNRVMSGDPLEIGNVGLEYFTFAKVGKIAGKVGKTGLKTSYSIGRTLSPKYFGAISRQLYIPPVTLRGVAIRTATGRAAEKAIKNALKKTGVTGKVTAFNKKLKAGKTNVNLKLDRIKRKSAKVKKEQKKVISGFKEAVEFGKSMQRAKKLRNKKLDYWKVRWAKRSFKANDAISNLEIFARDSGKIRALLFLKQKASIGQKLSKSKSDLFVRYIEESFVKAMRKTNNYKALKKLAQVNREFSIKIPKPHRIAKKHWNGVIKTLSNTKASKILNSVWTRADKSGKLALKPIKKVKSDIVIVKSIPKKITKKIKSELEYGRALRNARKRRVIKRDLKITQFKSVDYNYEKALKFVYDLSDSYAIARVLNIMKLAKKKGVVRGLTKVQQIEMKAKLKGEAIKYYRSRLEKFPEFQRLKKMVKLNDPYAKELITTKKIKSSRFYVNKLGSKLNKLKSEVNKKLEKRSMDINKGKIRRERAKKLQELKAEKLEKYLKSNRYLMDVKAAKKIKVLSRSQLTRTKTIKQYNKIVDELFDELGKRTKLEVNALQYRQLKNNIKKNLKKAFNRKDSKTLRDFKLATNKIITELNYPSKRPNIRVVRSFKVRKPRTKTLKEKKPFYISKGYRYKTNDKTFHKRKTFHIIEEFEPKVPKGQFKEVKVGNQILLKKIKKVKDVKVEPKIQVLKVVQVSKKKVSLMPLVRFSAQAIAGEMASSFIKKNIGASKVTSGSIFALVRAHSPVLMSDVATVSKTVPKSAFARLLAQQVKKAYPTITKTITKTKKKAIGIKLKRPKNTRKLSKKVMAYNVVMRSRGKAVRLKHPLLYTEAMDTAASKVDKKLIRTAKVVPAGLVDVIGILPKGVKGYYGKHRKKFRTYRKKKGKKISLTRTIIERKKYVGDLRSEQVALRKARKKKTKVVRRKKVVKRPVKRKQTKKIIKRKIVKRRPTKRVSKKPKSQKKKKTVKRRVKKVLKRKPVKRRVLKKKKPIRRKRK